MRAKNPDPLVRWHPQYKVFIDKEGQSFDKEIEWLKFTPV